MCVSASGFGACAMGPAPRSIANSEQIPIVTRFIFGLLRRRRSRGETSTYVCAKDTTSLPHLEADLSRDRSPLVLGFEREEIRTGRQPSESGVNPYIIGTLVKGLRRNDL